MSTGDESKDLYGAFRTRILSFDQYGAEPPLSTSNRLTGGLHTRMAPADAPFPNGVLRIHGRRNAGRDDSSLSEEGRLELQLYARGEQQIVTVSKVADIAEAALLNWHTDQCGWLTVREKEARDDLPPYTSPGSTRTFPLRLVWRFTWWPVYTAVTAVPAGSPAP